MSVVTFSTGAKFVARVVKSLTTNPSNQWANSYEFRALDAGTEADLLAMGEKLVNFEAAFHKDVVQFERLLISTWEPDSVPYDPSAFLSSSLSITGAIGPVGDNLPLDKCLSVARVAASGRFGHLFYRGVLNEADTAAPAGVSILSDRAGIQTLIDDALTSSSFDDHIGVAVDLLQLVMINADGTNVRLVLSLKAQGVSTVPTDHAWFNRTRIVVP